MKFLASTIALAVALVGQGVVANDCGPGPSLDQSDNNFRCDTPDNGHVFNCKGGASVTQGSGNDFTLQAGNQAISILIRCPDARTYQCPAGQSATFTDCSGPLQLVNYIVV